MKGRMPRILGMDFLKTIGAFEEIEGILKLKNIKMESEMKRMLANKR